MKTKIYLGLMITALLITNLACSDEGPETTSSSAQPIAQNSSPGVTLQAEMGTTIEFQTQNGETQQGSEPQKSMIPWLTLLHNNALTQPAQRTLLITVSGLEVPVTGAAIFLLIETQNGEPISNEVRWERIPVHKEVRQISASQEDANGAITFTVVFPKTISMDAELVRTPSGYYRYEITVTHDTTTLYAFEQDYAFLLESQWITPLPEVPEEAPGSAPDELVIYYCDMTPFQKNLQDTTTWIPRDEINDYIGYELLPRMVEAFRTQSQDWGFPWYPAWTSFRSGPDVERLSVALTDGNTWFHGRAFPRGNSLISINVYGSENYNYDTLIDGVMSTFHHELFHNHQKNIQQHLGGDGWIGGHQDQWQFFAEGTAVLASSIAQPAIQFGANASQRAYISNANLFLGSDTIRGDIQNAKDFSEISPYHAALYWRFLYEQCGGMVDGIENPTAGMRIIRNALTSLYQMGEAQAGSLESFDEWMPQVMDQALAGSACPFQSYAQSLSAFAQAVDALRSENGRCQEPGLPEGCGFYDPHSLYNNPPDNALAIISASQ